MYWSGQTTELRVGESEYYQKYLWLTELGIKPHELDLIPIEDQHAIWIMHLYKKERAKADHDKQTGSINVQGNNQPQGIGPTN